LAGFGRGARQGRPGPAAGTAGASIDAEAGRFAAVRRLRRRRPTSGSPQEPGAARAASQQPDA